MLEPDTMRPCNNANPCVFLILDLHAGRTTGAKASTAFASGQTPPLTWIAIRYARRTLNSLDPGREPLHKEGEGYVLHTNVEEVVLNATVLQGTQSGTDTEERQLSGL